MNQKLTMDDLIRYALSLDPDEFTFKGSDELFLIRPLTDVNVTIDGVRYIELKSVQIHNGHVKIYYGPTMTEVDIGECESFEIDNYPWEEIVDDVGK